jgi:uncharacterized protein YukE
VFVSVGGLGIEQVLGIELYVEVRVTVLQRFRFEVRVWSGLWIRNWNPPQIKLITTIYLLFSIMENLSIVSENWETILNAEKQHGLALRPNERRYSCEYQSVLHTVKKSNTLQWKKDCIELFLKNGHVVIEAVKKDGLRKKKALAEFIKSYCGVLQVIQVDFRELEMDWEELKSCHEKVWETAKGLKFGWGPFSINYRFILATVRHRYKLLKDVLEEFKQIRQMVINAVKKDDRSFHYTEEIHNLYHEAVKRDGRMLEFAPKEFQNNFQIVLEAVKQYGRALEDASTELKKNYDIVIQAVKQDGGALKFASKECQNNSNIVLEAVKQHGGALKFASTSLQDDYQIVIESVKQHGGALKFASERLRNNDQIVLVAVKKKGWAIVYASTKLQNHSEIGLEAVKQDPWALVNASEEFKKNYQIVRQAVKQNDHLLRYASTDLQNDQLLCFEVLKQKLSISF